jgi:hypothetical protein
MLYKIILLFIVITATWYFLFTYDPDNFLLNDNPEYGTINGWYSSKRSQYLNDQPITKYYNLMNKNLSNSDEPWKILHLPTADELPNYGDWWDWSTELQTINRVIDYLGNILGRYETHFISMAGTASSPGTRRVNNEAVARMSRDWKFGTNTPPAWPRRDMLVEECGGLCLKYIAKNRRLRFYMAIDLGSGHAPAMSQPWFINSSSDYKRNWLRNEIHASISHEYTHVFQQQIFHPRPDFMGSPVWNAEESLLGERAPNAISRWWIECFAVILPSFMGLQVGFDLQNKVIEAFDLIRNTQTLTAQELSDRMMYEKPYGYLPGTKYNVCSFLTAAYMAKLTSWKNILVDWYYDFQRVPSDNVVRRWWGTLLVPNLDNVFLHHFDKTEEDFLQDVFTKVRSNVITLNYLSSVLPGGADYNIPGLVPFTL